MFPYRRLNIRADLYRCSSVWRRGKDGTQVCNACGVYSRLRGKERPLALKKNKIRPRTKYPKAHPGNAK